MDKRWIYKPVPGKKFIQQLVKTIHVSEALAILLFQRNIMNLEEAKSFFRPSLDRLHDPFLMKDMDKAVYRLEESFAKKEKVLIYGDYDVDGTTSVALVYGFLQGYHPYLDFYIPDRQKEGYGVSKTAIDWAKENDFSLIIALDCGIKAIELVDYANTLGIDFIICDHHLPGDKLPNAYAVLDPKRLDCTYPFKELSGCGIGFKLLQALCQKNGMEPDRLYDSLDLTVVSIASDIVPIVGENRILAYYGLKKLNNTPKAGLKALIDIAGLSGDNLLNIRNLVFAIGPRINAAGRIQHAKQAVELLISHNKEKAEEFATLINKVNVERQNIDGLCTQEALGMIKERHHKGDTPKATILFKSGWHKGILGIVASRCIEHYHRPTIILTQPEGENHVTGSGRSVSGFNLYKALENCADLLEQFGGHHQAVGLTLRPENVQELQQRFEEVVAISILEKQLTPLLEIDLKLSLSQITRKFYQVLKQLAPFGPENMRPVFVSENLIVRHPQILKDKHVRFRVKDTQGNMSFPVIAFGQANHYQSLIEAKSLNLCYTIEENHYQNKTTLQLRAKDMKFNY